VKVEGTRTFAAPRETVWDVLNSPESMAKLMPGVESFDVQDDKHWRANVKIPLGMGGLRMSFDFTKLEERQPEFAKLHAKGNGVGAIVSMETAFNLAENGGSTDMKWEADVKIAGPVGSMGQRVLQPIVNQQVNNVLTALDKQVQEAAGGSGAEPETDSEVKDAGPPAEGPADPEGTSGAEEGISPLAPEAYDDEPEGPTQSTES
jgi:carbon monoxide dehydrogenase subunit G